MKGTIESHQIKSYDDQIKSVRDKIKSSSDELKVAINSRLSFPRSIVNRVRPQLGMLRGHAGNRDENKLVNYTKAYATF